MGVYEAFVGESACISDYCGRVLMSIRQLWGVSVRL